MPFMCIGRGGGEGTEEVMESRGRELKEEEEWGGEGIEGVGEHGAEGVGEIRW